MKAMTQWKACLAAAMVASCGLAAGVRADEPRHDGEGQVQPPAPPSTEPSHDENHSGDGAAQPRTIAQFLEAMAGEVRMMAGSAGNQMWSLVEAIKAGHGADAMPGAGSELGSRAGAKIDEIAAAGKARIDELIGGLVSRFTGGDAPASLIDALQQIGAAGDGAIDENARNAHIALTRALAASQSHPGDGDEPKGDRPSGGKPKGDGDKPKGTDGSKVKAEKPKPKPKPKPEPKPKPKARKPEGKEPEKGGRK
jgi:hypothetical protein